MPFRGKNVRVREVDEFDFGKAQLVFFAAGPAVTLRTPRAAAPVARSLTCPARCRPTRHRKSCRKANAQVLVGPAKKPIPDQQPEPFGYDAGGGAGAVAGFDRFAAH